MVSCMVHPHSVREKRQKCVEFDFTHDHGHNYLVVLSALHDSWFRVESRENGAFLSNRTTSHSPSLKNTSAQTILTTR